MKIINSVGGGYLALGLTGDGLWLRQGADVFGGATDWSFDGGRWPVWSEAEIALQVDEMMSVERTGGEVALEGGVVEHVRPEPTSSRGFDRDGRGLGLSYSYGDT